MKVNGTAVMSCLILMLEKEVLTTELKTFDAQHGFCAALISGDKLKKLGVIDETTQKESCRRLQELFAY